MSSPLPLGPAQLTNLIRLVTQAVHTRPESFVLFDSIAMRVWHRYRGSDGQGDDAEPDVTPILDLFTGDWEGDSATVDLLSSWQGMSSTARDIVADCIAVTSRTSDGPPRAASALYRLERGLERITGKYLSQSEVAQLAAFLTRRAALSTRRGTHTTDDAASARLQVLADQFQYLTAEQQQHIAALVAALANGTPDARTARRATARRFLVETFNAEELSYFANVAAHVKPRKSEPT